MKRMHRLNRLERILKDHIIKNTKRYESKKYEIFGSSVVSGELPGCNQYKDKKLNE